MTGCFRALCLGVLFTFVSALEPTIFPIKTTLTIDLTPTENIVKESNYKGHVEIKFNVSTKSQPFSSININAKTNLIKFDQSKVTLTENNVIYIGIKDVTGKDEETYTIKLNDNIYANRTYIIKIDFEGKTSKDSIAFTEEVMYTAFPLGKPHYIFPCFNVNNEKTPFELSVLHKKEWYTYAYTQGTRKENDVKTETHFETSEQRLSSYSIGFALVKGYTEVQAEKNITFVVKINNTVPNFLKKCATVAPFIDYVQQIENEFNIHIIAVPRHYNSGFFGSTLNLILAEASLLKIDEEMTTDEKVKLCGDILSVLAEQFFGVMVTSNDNEERDKKIINSVFPRYLGNKAFGQMSSVFSEDLIRARQAMIMEEAIKRNNDIIFGTAVLDMLDNKMKEHLIEFFKQRLEYNFADRQDFEDFLSNRTDLKNSEIKNWLDKIFINPSIPTVKVGTNNNGSAVIKCTEEVVFKVMYRNDKKEDDYVLCNGTTNEPLNSEWIIANYNGTGLYRVFYESVNIRKVLAQNMSQWGMEARTRLLSDAFYWWEEKKSGNLLTYEVDEALSFTPYMINEYYSTPWKIVNEGFNYIKRLFFKINGKDSRRAEFVQKANTLLPYVTHYLGFNQMSSDLNEMKSLRETILITNRNLEVQNVTSNLSQIYDQVRKYIKKPNEFGPDTLYPAFISYMHKEIKCNKEWDSFFSWYSSGINTFQKMRFFNGFADSLCVKKFLNEIYNISDQNDQDLAFRIFISKPQQIGPIITAWANYSKTEFEENDRISVMVKMLNLMGSNINDLALSKKLSLIKNNCIRFIDDIRCNSLSKAIEDVNVTIGNNDKFLKDNEKYLMRWKIVPDDPSTPLPLTSQSWSTDGPNTPTSGTRQTGSGSTGTPTATPTATTKKGNGAQGIYTHQVHLSLLIAFVLHVGFLIF